MGDWRRLSLQPLQAVEIERGVAPLQDLDRLELVIFQRVDEIGGEGLDVAGDAEGAVVHMAAGAARDLAKLAGGQLAMLRPSNLRVPAKAT